MKNRNLRIFLNILLGIGIISLSIFLFVSIISHNELDSSFNMSTNSNLIFNKAGKIGAYISDLFIQLFGVISLAIVAIIAKIGFNILKSKLVRYNVFLKILMTIIFILSSCALVSKIFTNKNYWGYESWGGIIGYYINYLTLYLPYLFLVIFYSICCLLSLNIITDFSYKKTFILTVKLFRLIKNLIKLIFKLIFKLLIILTPNKIIIKITNIIKIIKLKFTNNKDKNEYKNLIFNNSKKLENIEKYINKINTDKYKKEQKQNSFSSNENNNKKIIIKNGKSIKYKIPVLDILNSSTDKTTILTKEELKSQATELLKVLNEFKISGKIISVKAGPVITLHEFEPCAGTKSSRIIGLADDIARNLRVKSARISVISERNVVGIELPNKTRNTIFLKDIFESPEYKNCKYALPIVLGSNIAGDSVIMDLAKAPHLLIAGTTGSGKSVSINTMILSLLYKFTPDECKIIMIDPKMLELSVYEGIPHLLTPVVTDSKKAIMSLKWVVNEMENRYRTMSSLGVRNIYGYNEKVNRALRENTTLCSKILIGYDEYGEPIYENKELETKPLPFIVVVVDEMADLMITAGKDIEALIQRIAQMARAAGIHIIMATQRPSVDIITGVIKANFPSRISFLVSSKIDSKVILGEQGAEQLLGMGDMLYMPNGGKINRAHGPFVSDSEVERVVNFIIKQGVKPEYIKTILNSEDDENNSTDNLDISITGDRSDDEQLYREAIDIIRRDKKVSISYIQRQLRIGYNKSANIIERMEKEGIISEPSINGKREILNNN